MEEATVCQRVYRAITDYIKTQKNIKKVYLINQDYVFDHSVRYASLAMVKAKRPDIQIVGNTLGSSPA